MILHSNTFYMYLQFSFTEFAQNQVFTIPLVRVCESKKGWHVQYSTVRTTGGRATKRYAVCVWMLKACTSG
jgi:hypothetical protein